MGIKPFSSTFIVHLDDEDIRIIRGIISMQSHFCLNSECLEDAVITGILRQIDEEGPVVASYDCIADLGLAKMDIEDALKKLRLSQERTDWIITKLLQDLKDRVDGIKESL